MGIFNESNAKKIMKILEGMKNEVNIIFFTQEFECEICSNVKRFLEEIVTFNPKIRLKILDFEEHKDKAAEYGVDRIPAIVLLDSKEEYCRIKYYGIPGGYEINSFIKTILEISGNREKITEDVLERINSVKKKVNIKVFVSLTCPYCPVAVSIAHRLAMENKNITGEMIDSTMFPVLSMKYDVTSVPKIIINDTIEVLGVQSPEKILEIIETL